MADCIINYYMSDYGFVDKANTFILVFLCWYCSGLITTTTMFVFHIGHYVFSILLFVVNF